MTIFRQYSISTGMWWIRGCEPTSIISGELKLREQEVSIKAFIKKNLSRDKSILYSNQNTSVFWCVFTSFLCWSNGFVIAKNELVIVKWAIKPSLCMHEEVSNSNSLEVWCVYLGWLYHVYWKQKTQDVPQSPVPILVSIELHQFQTHHREIYGWRFEICWAGILLR